MTDSPPSPDFSRREKALSVFCIGIGISAGMWLGLAFVPPEAFTESLQTPETPEQVFDLHYIPLNHGHFFLSAIIPLCSGAYAYRTLYLYDSDTQSEVSSDD